MKSAKRASSARAVSRRRRVPTKASHRRRRIGSLKLLVVVDNQEMTVERGMRNLSGITLMNANDLNAWHLASALNVLVTQTALQTLLNRFPQG